MLDTVTLLTEKLGAGESGKSTIMKQLRLFHESCFQQQELEEYKAIVYRNISSLLMDVWQALKNEQGEVDADLFAQPEDVFRIMDVFKQMSPTLMQFNEEEVGQIRTILQESIFRKVMAGEETKFTSKLTLDDSAE
jgi:hypothetical protein